MRQVYITHHNIISSLGFDSQTNFKNLLSNKSGIAEVKSNDGKLYYSSIVDKEKVDIEFSKIGDVDGYTTLEKMMILSIAKIIVLSKIKISEKTGLIIATTKGNVDVLSPESKFHKDKKRAYLYALGEQVRDFFKFKNEAIVLSNACVSGVLAISVADRLIKSKMYDDVIIVSGDLVNDFILSGFSSFQALSEEPCKPFSINRTGINIGEAVASALISSSISETSGSIIQVIGSGTSNDANHISGPSRTGEGLYLSVKSALKEAQITENEIDYISAHGTATPFNDEMESKAFGRLNMLDIPLNSLKGYYGHTLGASGMLESIIGMESLQHNTLIASLGFDELGVSEPLNIIRDNVHKELKIFLKTASGFGGCNSAVIFKKISSN
jgi:3-oxoacyl-[acyl-carrier-protein] synthase-1